MWEPLELGEQEKQLLLEILVQQQQLMAKLNIQASAIKLTTQELVNGPSSSPRFDQSGTGSQFLLIVVSGSIMWLVSELTFTPSWGKRSAAPLAMNLPNSFGVQDSCKTPVDSLMVIYRMIQTEAQKILECNQK